MNSTGLYSDIGTGLVEQIKTLLTNNITENGLEDKIYNMYDDFDELPAVVVANEGATEYLPNTNIFQYTITVTVLSEPNTGDHVQLHALRNQDVMNWIVNDSLAAELMTLFDATVNVYYISWPSHDYSISAGRVFSSEQTLEIIASPAS
tara:strand:- start:75 stop:521 length:447 start_codon:yes stop_codon:yes gene_type:complete